MEEGRSRGSIVALMGALGGLGVTSMGVFLMRALSAMRCSVAFVDADPAAGAGLLLGSGLSVGMTWAHMPQGDLEFRGAKFSQALPQWMGARILTGDGSAGPGSMEQIYGASRALAQVHDLVLLDLPRGWVPPPESHVLILSDLSLASVLSTRLLVERLRAGEIASVHVVGRPRGDDIELEGLGRYTGCAFAGVWATDRSLPQRAARGDDITRGRGGARKSGRAIAEVLLEQIVVPELHAQGEPQ